ncbi:hypothetical protein [Candidatus Desulforudis audaxviator]|nr:hypothetical protein [Candidatus Desulforudis audaxviator]
MTGSCQVCRGVGELEENCLIEVCRQCWAIYCQTRSLVMATVTCGGCATWQKSVFNGETPQCRECDHPKQSTVMEKCTA